jgi:hypothetical protein
MGGEFVETVEIGGRPGQARPTLEGIERNRLKSRRHACLAEPDEERVPLLNEITIVVPKRGAERLPCAREVRPREPSENWRFRSIRKKVGFSWISQIHHPTSDPFL